MRHPPCSETLAVEASFWTSCLVLHNKVVSRLLLIHILLRFALVDSRPVVRWISSEGDFQLSQEAVHTLQKGHRRGGDTMNTWLTFINNHTISEVRCHNKIVFNNEGSLLRMQNKPLDDSSSDNTLFYIQIGRWLINKENVGWLAECKCQSNSLQLSTRQVLHTRILDGLNEHRLGNI